MTEIYNSGGQFNGIKGTYGPRLLRTREKRVSGNQTLVTKASKIASNNLHPGFAYFMNSFIIPEGEKGGVVSRPNCKYNRFGSKTLAIYTLMLESIDAPNCIRWYNSHLKLDFRLSLNAPSFPFLRNFVRLRSKYSFEERNSRSGIAFRKKKDRNEFIYSKNCSSRREIDMKINDDFGNFRKGNREIESRTGIVIASRGDNQSRRVGK